MYHNFTVQRKIFSFFSTINLPINNKFVDIKESFFLLGFSSFQDWVKFLVHIGDFFWEVTGNTNLWAFWWYFNKYEDWKPKKKIRAQP